MIGILYPGPRSVAYSSLFYRMARAKLTEERVYHGSYFLEDHGIASERGPGPLRAKALLVSLPYEVMYRDLAEMLLLAGSDPLSPSSRRDTVIIAGGPAVTANPAPILGIVDAVLAGEIEDIFDDIISVVWDSASKAVLLRRLAEIPGMLVPEVSEAPVRRHYIRDLDSYLPLDQDIPGDAEPVWGRSFIIETSRGCARGCRFCMEGFIFRPKRDRSLLALKRMIDAAQRSGYGRVSFYSLSFFDNPAAEKALGEAVSRGLEASVPSLRADTLTRDRIQLIAEAGQRTLTIAPETGSCRLCKAINKKIEPDLVEWIVEEAFEAGIRAIKLYLITGFPGETEDDYKQTLALVERLVAVARGRGGRIRVSLNMLIPKPVTPLQWAGLADTGIVRARQRALLKLRKLGPLDVSVYDPKWAEIQLALSRAGREIGPLIVEWARAGRGRSHFRRAARLTGIDYKRYLKPIPPEVVPHWHRLVEHPYARVEALRSEYRMYIESIGFDA